MAYIRLAPDQCGTEVRIFAGRPIFIRRVFSRECKAVQATSLSSRTQPVLASALGWKIALCFRYLRLLLLWGLFGSGAFTPNIRVGGAYCEGKEGMIPRFGIKFLDGEHVDLYADGAKLGATCTYVVHGNNILLTRACGVWHLDKKGDDFYNED